MRFRNPVSCNPTREKPRQKLPVSTHPTVKPFRVRHVPRWEVIVELDIRGKSNASEGALEEVVAEERVVGNASLHRGFESLNVVDSLSDIRALGEEVLIDVGDHVRVRVKACLPREEPREP